jgi:hypothetical protein
MIAAIYVRKRTEPTVTTEILAAAFALTLFFSGPVLGDVVELKSGQRIEGTLKQADQATVTVEVGGQVVKFKAEQVRAVYYGAAPSTTAAVPPSSDALRALKALQSAATAGVSYRDYAPRVTDAKIQVDQYLAGNPTGPERIAIAKAMDFYVFASSAWNAQVGRSGYEAVGASPLINECAALSAHATAADARFPGRNPSDRATTRGISISISGVPVVWTCAAAQLAEAEKLLAEKK